MVIAFWNINNNTDLVDLLVDFVKEQSVDFLLLAESDKNPKGKRNCTVDDIILDFLIKSKKVIGKNFNLVPNSDFRVKTLTSYDLSYVASKHSEINSERWSAILFDMPGLIKLNLFPVHFPSKVNWSDTSLALECANFARDIKHIEGKTNCSNSILIGDFNMNPFGKGVVAANGINALQDLNYLKDNPQGREVNGVFYRYFYNPMWNHFGDENVPFGTLYHRNSDLVSYEWNMFDQVILRPEMRSYLKKDSIQIVTKISGQRLTKKYERPDDNYSDHLPIIVTLKI